MSKETKTPTVISFMDAHWTDHPAVDWISNNKQTILWIIVGLFAVLILSYRILMNHNLNAEADFFRAQTDFAKFQDAAQNSNDQLSQAGSLSNLESLMKSHPELHQKFDGPLAQTLLIEGQIPPAEAYAQATFKRTANDSISLYHDFAATSLVIGKKDYQQALTQAQNLNAKIKADDKHQQNVLYFFNLVRLALLNQQLNMAKDEKLSWENLKNGQLNLDSKVFNLFKIGQATLNEYIEMRMKILNQA
jgi:hypothetical protein